jgi:rubredoxin
VIDESADLDTVVGDPPNPPTELHIDCRKVDRINSMGVKAWISYFKKAQAKRVKLHFWNVSQPILQQINQVQNFACGGTVHSFEASFECENCEHVFNLMLKSEDVKAAGMEIADQKCPACGAEEGVFDEIPDVYLKFLQRDEE